MRIAYLDCYYGVTPRKLLSAIIDAGIEANILIEEMKKLNIPFEIDVKREKRGQNKATNIKLKSEEKRCPTTLKEIINLINLSYLESGIKSTVKLIYDKIGEVESKIHKEPKEKVHLYEVGQPKAILIVTGIVAGIKKLKIGEVYCSGLSLGSGNVKCSHGILSVPVPATSLLVKNIPTYALDIKGEMTTPLGTAIVSFLVKKNGHPRSGWGRIPLMFIERIGQGFGANDGPLPSEPLSIYLGRKRRTI